MRQEKYQSAVETYSELLSFNLDADRILNIYNKIAMCYDLLGKL